MDDRWPGEQRDDAAEREERSEWDGGLAALGDPEPGHDRRADDRPGDDTDEQRDGHLKSAEFFDAEKFPALTFKSLSVRINGPADHEVTGELTLHGVTKTVTFAVEGPSAPGKDPWGNTRIGLSATAKINRKDFGLTWNAALETCGVLVGEEVAISLDVQFIKA